MSAQTVFPLLDHFWSTLPPQLVSKEAKNKLQKAALFFPPVARIGLECRLNGDPRVDLQQCLLRNTDDLSTVRAWLAAQESLDRTDWKNFEHFLREWCTQGSYFHLRIPEIYLELDVLPGNVRTPLVFLAVQPDLPPAELEGIVERILGSKHRGLARCFAALPPFARVHFIGIPFSREKEILRINVKGLQFAEVLPTLASLGWDATPFEADIWQAYHLSDKVHLCLDLGQELYPHLGLECIWEDQPRQDQRWSHFFQSMHNRGLCQEDKANAVLKWEDSYYPERGKTWPQDFWLASLQRPEDEFTSLKRIVSHLKLTVGPEPALKAYLGYGHVWEKETPPPKHQEQNPLPLKTTIARGVDFLLDQQKSSGAWVDFRLPLGKSDEWVSAYVAYHLCHLPHRNTDRALNAAAVYLIKRFVTDAGWGHNCISLKDADSSIWAVLFLTNRNIPCNTAILDRFKAASGGIHTYVESDTAMQHMTQTPKDTRFTGWKDVHACVTAAYALGGDPAAKAFIQAAQLPDGSIPYYWWTTAAYATALAAEAMDPTIPTDRDFLRGAERWAVSQHASAKGDAFQLANLLRILVRAGKNPPLIRQIKDEVLALQRPDGSFEGTAGLRIPRLSALSISKDAPVYQDTQANFTTATVIFALQKVLNETSPSAYDSPD